MLHGKAIWKPGISKIAKASKGTASWTLQGEGLTTVAHKLPVAMANVLTHVGLWPVSFANFIRIHFFIEHLQWLLLRKLRDILRERERRGFLERITSISSWNVSVISIFWVTVYSGKCSVSSRGAWLLLVTQKQKMSVSFNPDFSWTEAAAGKFSVKKVF